MPAARATSDSVIDDQSRLSSNSRMPSRIESRSSTRDASAYGMRCALLEPCRSPPAVRAGGTPTRVPKSRGRVTRATLSLPVASLAQDLFPSLRSPRISSRRFARPGSLLVASLAQDLFSSLRSPRPPSRARDLYHLEIGFRRAAVWAAPVVGDVVPPGARGDAVLGPALGLVVLESALHADEQFEWVGSSPCPTGGRYPHFAQALTACHFIAPSLFRNLFEVDLLAHCAVRAAPVRGDVTPRRARRESSSRSAFRLVIDVVTARASIGPHACGP